MKRLLALTLSVLLLAGCAPAAQPPEDVSTPPPSPPPAVQPEPVPEPDPRQEAIDLSSMSTEEKVGSSSLPTALPKTRRTGGGAPSGGGTSSSAEISRQSVQQVQEEIAAWQEGCPSSAQSHRRGGGHRGPVTETQDRKERFLSPGKLYQQGGCHPGDCQERRPPPLTGINVNFAPVADLSPTPGFIYDRTLGGVEGTCRYISAVTLRWRKTG